VERRPRSDAWLSKKTCADLRPSSRSKQKNSHSALSLEEARARSVSRLQELRSLTYLLHPQHLLEEGLKATIEKFAEGFAARTSLRIGITISPAVRRLSHETQRSLMRIVQEALTNVHRHARATKVEIAIGERKKYFKLEIRDNGQGMFARSACRDRPPPLGTGLRIMRVRLQEMGGRLEILSAPTTRRRGTIVRATFPFGHAIERIDRMRELKKTLSPSAHRGFNLGCFTASCRDDFDTKVRSGGREQRRDERGWRDRRLGF
jgi:signal transduction histidine kinase